MAKKKNGLFIEYKNQHQRLAYALFQQHDVLFLSGPAGSAKTFLATAFAIRECLENKKKIIITRPIVEAGEKLGFLPGDFAQKVDPYMYPIYDSIDQLVGTDGPHRERVDACLEVAPIAFLRGRTFRNAICILDEAQNATIDQLILFLSRLGEDSKMIITGDPFQSDIGGNSGFTRAIDRLETLAGVGVIKFPNEAIVRHPLVGKMLDRLKEI